MVMISEDRTRGQIILIGAIALAFIILGVVVVFNGVLYTETVSSGSSSQSASTADATTAEVNRSLECLLESLNEDGSYSGESDVASEIRTLSDHYRETNARATPAVANISVDNVGIDGGSGAIDNATVTVTYDSHDLSYNRTHEEIEPATGCVDP